MFDGMSIYVCTDTIPYFVMNILPSINHTFYLVTGDSDTTVPGGYFVGTDTRLHDAICLSLLDNTKLLRWFAQNCIFTRNVNDGENYDSYHFYNCEWSQGKMTQLPIGLDYHTIANDHFKFWRMPHEDPSVLGQEAILCGLRESMRPFWERNHEKILAAFTFNETPSCPRWSALKKIPSDLVHHEKETMPRTRVWQMMNEFAFVLSPTSSGLDCHRHWECLALGCIPVMLSWGTNEMFDDLPVLIVDSYSEVTDELLRTTLESFKTRTFNYDKLQLQHWVKQFSVTQKQ
jgi:hypothetical protein